MEGEPAGLQDSKLEHGATRADAGLAFSFKQSDFAAALENPAFAVILTYNVPLRGLTG